MVEKPDIPGFYFDETKNRYFKIEKDGNVQRSHPHSKSAVGQKRVASAEQTRKTLKKVQLEQTMRIQPIKRSSLWENSFEKTRISIAIASHVRDQDLTKAYLQLFPSGDYILRPYASLKNDPHLHKRPREMMTFILPPSPAGLSRGNNFVFDDVMNVLYSTENLSEISRFESIVLQRTNFRESDPFGMVKLSSKHLSLSQFLHVQGLGHSRAPLSMILCQLDLIPGRTLSSFGPVNDSGDIRCKNFASVKNSPLMSNIQSVLQCSVMEIGGHTAMALNPFGQALSVDHKLYECSINQSGYACFDSLVGSAPSTITSIDWITPNLIACGTRTGMAVLFDRRTKEGTATPRINHGTCINHLKRTADNAFSLVIAGLGNKMSLYDLRYTKAPGQTPTKSVFDFDYSNAAHTQIGFDRSIKYNIITAAQDDGSFRVYSSKNGEVLRTFQTPRTHRLSPDELHLGSAVVTKLQIIDDDAAKFRIFALQKDRLWVYGPDDAYNFYADKDGDWSLKGFDDHD